MITWDPEIERHRAYRDIRADVIDEVADSMLGAPAREVVAAIQQRLNRGLPRVVEVEVGIEATSETLTDAHLTALFAAHCECRPLDIDRTEDEHSHDCDTSILDDIQTAIHAVDGDEQCAARFRCAERWNADLISDVYAPRLAAAYSHGATP